ncbi:MAG: DUF930 domain-containing protein [Rhizobiales bacterium]|nr:DUF930 domain-containing protein [Hyphomicrobiales bacterium]
MPSAKYLLPISALTLTFMTSAGAADSRFIASLSKLDPQTRLEQVCDLAAVTHIGKSEKLPRPDRAKANVITAPRVRGDTIVGSGGAFRSGGKWYAFSFTCKGSPDHLKVLSFTYRVGELIPKSKWPEYGLWD